MTTSATRRRRHKSPASVQLNVRVPVQLDDAVSKAAAERGMSVAEFTRKALAQAIEEGP